MNEQTEGKKSFGTRLTVWILNAVIAVLCVLSIACYFFGPVWKVDVTYTLTADQLQKLIGNDTGLDFDVHDVIGEEGEKISVSLSLSASHLFGSIGAADKTVDEIVDSNVDAISAQLSKDLNGFAKKVVKSVAKNTVKKEVKNTVHKYLQENTENSNVTIEEVEEKLNDLGFTDDYIAEKTDQLIDEVFEGGGNIDTVTESIMDTVDEVYEDFKENASGKEGFEDYADVELTEEDKAQIEDAVRDVLKKVAQEDGSIDPDELIAELIEEALKSDSGKNKGEAKAPEGVVMLAAQAPADGGSSSSAETIASAIKGKLNEYLNDNVRFYASIALYVMLGVMILAMIPWLYILIKLIVKVVKNGPNPTVKLALPIWLGWLFFLLFVGVPTIGIWIFRMPAIASMPALSGIMEYVNQMTLSVSSFSWISALCALIAFAISIYYMIARRQLKKAESAPDEDYYSVGISEETENPIAESAVEEPQAEETPAEPIAESAPTEGPFAEPQPSEEANEGMQEEIAVSDPATENGQN